MARGLAVGGIFFKSPDPKSLDKGYSDWLGMELEDWGTAYYPKSIPATGQTVGSAFPAAMKYFEPSKKEFMFNLIVDAREEALGHLKAGGAEIIGEIEKFEYGLFGWFVDPDGNKVEL